MQEKYLAEFIWRYDGSYIFPRDNRFGFFPGILLGWNVSSEDWFDFGGFAHLKIRASYGQMGNDQVFLNGQLQEFEEDESCVPCYWELVKRSYSKARYNNTSYEKSKYYYQQIETALTIYRYQPGRN